MRAVVHDSYGPPDVLRLEEVERPVPKEHEVLVKVHATTVTRSDCGFRAAEPFFARFFTGLRRPKRRIPGMELAGVVEAVGGAVTEFAVGDEVFGIKGRCERGVRLRPRDRRARAQARGHELRRGRGRLRRRGHRTRVPAEGRCARGDSASSSTAPPARSEPRPCSSPSTLGPTSRRSATRRTSSSCARSEPTGRRLRAGGLHEERRDLRRRLRRCRQALVPALSRDR